MITRLPELGVTENHQIKNVMAQGIYWIYGESGVIRYWRKFY